MMIPSAGKKATALLEIDLDAYADNIGLLQSMAPGALLAGVVKANAYGIGLEQAAHTHVACGTHIFFVATPDEGIMLRSILGPGRTVAILGGYFKGAEAEYDHYHLTPVLNSLEDCHRCPKGTAAIVHVDTGMRRLGLDSDETDRILKDPDIISGLNVQLIMSHFACADEPGHPLTSQQFLLFRRIAALFPRAKKSISNSAGMFASPEYHCDLVRPGMATYGLNPAAGSNPMKQVVSLYARVLQVRNVRISETVGYGATWKAVGLGRVATVALGYADGFLRSISNKGALYAGDVACPIIGRVSMDLVTIDSTNAPELQAGDFVEVMGPHQDADTIAGYAGTIGYEILTGLGARYERVYSRTKTFDSCSVSG